MKTRILTILLGASMLLACSEKDAVTSAYSGGSSSGENGFSSVDNGATSIDITSTGSTTEMTAMPEAQTPSQLLSSCTSYITSATNYNKDISYTTTHSDYIESMTFNHEIFITFNGSSATVTPQVDSVSVSISGADVVITSTAQNIKYILTGNSDDGMFKLYSTYKYGLTLSGLKLTNADGPALNLQSNKRAYIDIPEGTTNTIADGAVYAESEEDQKGAIFANGKLLFSGNGTLNVTGNYKHAMASDDYIVTRYGITLNATAKVSDAMHANDGIYIRGGELHLTANSNGMAVDKGPLVITNGEVHITSVNDALKTEYATADLPRAMYINGGLLELNTTGDKAHAINAIDSVLITDGVIIASTTGTASKGIKADGKVLISGGETYISTTGNAIYADSDVSAAHGVKCANFYATGGNMHVAVSGKGAKGISSDGVIQINGGYFYASASGASYTYSNSLHSYAKGIKADGNITVNAGNLISYATGGNKCEGIESKGNISVTGGYMMAYAYDDGINSAGQLNVSGGKVYARSTNNDGIDSNGKINISGGLVVGVGATSPQEGIDTDSNSNFVVTGGTIVGIGGKGMSCYPQGSGTSQYSVFYGGSASAGTNMAISDGSQNLLIISALQNYSNDFGLLFSSPNLKSGTTYYLTSGGTISGGTNIFGYYTDATYSGGSDLVSGGFALSSISTTIGNVSGGGQGGGPGGHGGGGPWGH